MDYFTLILKKHNKYNFKYYISNYYYKYYIIIAQKLKNQLWLIKYFKYILNFVNHQYEFQ